MIFLFESCMIKINNKNYYYLDLTILPFCSNVKKNFHNCKIKLPEGRTEPRLPAKKSWFYQDALRIRSVSASVSSGVPAILTLMYGFAPALTITRFLSEETSAETCFISIFF